MNAVTPVLFILGLLAISAGTLSYAFARARAARRELERRTDLVAVTVDSDVPGKLPKRFAEATVKGFVQNMFAVGLPYRWGMEASATVLLATAAISAAAAWFLFHAFLHFSIVIAAAATAAGFMLGPRQILKRQQARAELLFMDLFPTTIDMIVRMVRAGLTIVGAIRLVGNEAPPPVNRIFTRWPTDRDRRSARQSSGACGRPDWPVRLPVFRRCSLAATCNRRKRGGHSRNTIRYCPKATRSAFEGEIDDRGSASFGDHSRRFAVCRHRRAFARKPCLSRPSGDGPPRQYHRRRCHILLSLGFASCDR